MSDPERDMEISNEVVRGKSNNGSSSESPVESEGEFGSRRYYLRSNRSSRRSVAKDKKKTLQSKSKELDIEIENLEKEVRTKSDERDRRAAMLGEVNYLVKDLKLAADQIEEERKLIQETIEIGQQDIERLYERKQMKQSEKRDVERSVQEIECDLEKALKRKDEVERELDNCIEGIRDAVKKREEYERREAEVAEEWEEKLQNDARVRYKEFKAKEDKEREMRIRELEKRDKDFEKEIEKLQKQVKVRRDTVKKLEESIVAVRPTRNKSNKHSKKMVESMSESNIGSESESEAERFYDRSANRFRCLRVSDSVDKHGKSRYNIEDDDRKERKSDGGHVAYEPLNRPKLKKIKRRTKKLSSRSIDEYSSSESDVGVGSKGRKHEMKSQKFDGKTVFADFLSQFEACRDYNGWDRKEATFQLFSCCQGDALNRLTTDGVNPRTASYEAMVELLEREFGPRECKSSYILELSQVKQKQGESARELGNRIKRLTSLAFRGKDNGSKATREEMALNTFTLALRRKDVRDTVFGAEFGTLKQAIDKAEYLESYHKRDEESVDKKRVSFTRKLGKSSESEVEDRVYERVMKKFVGGQGKLTKSTMGTDEKRKGGRERGSDLEVSVRALVETTRNLIKQNKTQPPKKGAEENRSPKGGIQVTCYSCGEMGHVRRNCPHQMPRQQHNNTNRCTPGHCLNCLEPGHGWRECSYQALCFTCHNSNHWSRDSPMNAQGNGGRPSRGPQGRPQQHPRGQEGHVRSQSYSRAASPIPSQ